MSSAQRKLLGQYFTPPDVVASLVRWAVRGDDERFLDPSCGDGRFVRQHDRSVGVDLCEVSLAAARAAAPSAEFHHADFFQWAEDTPERFDAVGGNPPFIRYQHFTGATRERAGRLAAKVGAQFTGLASSWAPFIAVAASLLRPGGRLAFVVPAEIGHAPYAQPLLASLCERFARVLVVAVRDKLFPELSEDAWLLYAEGRGESTDSIELALRERFEPSVHPPEPDKTIPLGAWRRSGCRLRKHLLPGEVIALYEDMQRHRLVRRFGDVASASIGYVSGANDFFHLSESQAAHLGIPARLLRPTVRKGDQLPADAVTTETVRGWLSAGLPALLLDLSSQRRLPPSVRQYLDSPEGLRARAAYKCRVRDPWYAVPGVVVPDGFLSYMAGLETRLVRNEARCVCTNSVLAVTLRQPADLACIQRAWSSPLARLSQELEGHPLGGGMLKLEPKEAANTLVPDAAAPELAEWDGLVREGIEIARRWRHIRP